MDFKKLSMVIPVFGVIGMFVWGVFGKAWDKSWICVVVAGLVAGILRTLDIDGNDDKDGKDK